MEIGLVGLGRMGANMSRRWQRNGHKVIGYARTAATVDGKYRLGSMSWNASCGWFESRRANSRRSRTS